MSLLQALSAQAEMICGIDLDFRAPPLPVIAEPEAQAHCPGCGVAQPFPAGLCLDCTVQHLVAL